MGFNPFGMKLATKRKTTRLKNRVQGGKYAAYISAGHALRDLFLWFDTKNFPKQVESADEYVFLLKINGYFTDLSKNYLDGIEYYLRK